MSRFLTIQLCLKRVSACVVLWRFMFQAEVCAFFRSLGEFRKIVLLCKEEDKADCSNGVWITLTRTLIPYNISVLVCFSRNHQKIEGFLPLFCVFLFWTIFYFSVFSYLWPNVITFLIIYIWDNSDYNLILIFLLWTGISIYGFYFLSSLGLGILSIFTWVKICIVAFSCLSISGPNVFI